ncbi:traU family protein [Orientia tsutsugamushi str. Gilliam]|uniref:TraU family protein n=1 Tax=Orientia tsutsugamushi str. Gilliam TaxID=1359184 RepID=A0A0F3M8P7_ORITS|nr:traU family protein [Orientia tsutsugamushi str. Gilliam]
MYGKSWGFPFGSATQKGMKDEAEGNAFYHIHWYVYSMIYWLEILLDFICLEMAAVDIAYLTEFDPLWSDDAKSAIFKFGNVVVSKCSCLSSMYS